MAVSSKIQWTDDTVNFWYGCDMISEGCRFCYWFRDAYKYGHKPRKLIRASDENFYEAFKKVTPRKIFTCSWSDFFHSRVKKAWRADAWEVIWKTSYAQWLILTKRASSILKNLPENWGDGWDNVWLGVTVENTDRKAMNRIRDLQKIPAKVKFLSVEPLISAIPDLPLDGIDWVILGGESGNEEGKFRYRECRLEWLEDIAEQCKTKGVPVFVKQLGTDLANKCEIEELTIKYNEGKPKNEEKEYDGHSGDIDFFPESLKIRQYPKHWHNFIADYD